MPKSIKIKTTKNNIKNLWNQWNKALVHLEYQHDRQSIIQTNEKEVREYPNWQNQKQKEGHKNRYRGNPKNRNGILQKPAQHSLGKSKGKWINSW